MFTGIVQALGIVLAAAESAAGKRLTVSLAELVDAKIESGDSICVSGVCLTVVKQSNGHVQFDVVAETLRKTTLGAKRPQDRVNLELSLRGDSYLGGHFVQGHVDAVAKVAAIENNSADWRITFEMDDALAPFVVPQGSVAVDGVSMTIASLGKNEFTLAVIPTTLERTTLGALIAGDKVNVETDILTRSVVHYLRQLSTAGAGGAHSAIPTIPWAPPSEGTGRA